MDNQLVIPESLRQTAAQRPPPNYLGHTFSSGGAALIRPASANQRARAAATAAVASAAVRQRPASASIRRPSQAGAATAPAASSEWLQLHSSSQHAEIEALRRRTRALHKGPTLAQRSPMGPTGCARSRPTSASHHGRVAAFLAAREPAAEFVAATRVSHRPAPTRPPTALTNERPGPHAVVADIDTDDEDEAPLNVGQYRRQAQRSLMLSHLRESSASFPGLAQIDWAHLDNQGLHAAVSAIVRVHTALQASGVQQNSAESVAMQQQLSALYAAAAQTSGAAGLTEEQLNTLPILPCDKKRLILLVEAERTTCAICHDEFCLDQELRCLPACEHMYHANCIGHWLRIKSSCPLCNQKVKAVD